MVTSRPQAHVRRTTFSNIYDAPGQESKRSDAGMHTA